MLASTGRRVDGRAVNAILKSRARTLGPLPPTGDLQSVSASFPGSTAPLLRILTCVPRALRALGGWWRGRGPPPHALLHPPWAAGGPRSDLFGLARAAGVASSRAASERVLRAAAHVRHGQLRRAPAEGRCC